jgi:F-type H+-transporting ATPase subunit delta
MSERAEAIAEEYASAMMTLASDRGEAEQVVNDFAELISLMDADPEFEAFMVASSVDADPRRQSLERLFRGKMNDLLLNTIQIMNGRGRHALVRAVYRRVVLYMQTRSRQQEVVVQTAIPLSQELEQHITETLAARLDKEILLRVVVRPELIGGIVIRFGDVQIDGSVASQIRRSQARLVERGRERVRGDDRYIEVS